MSQAKKYVTDTLPNDCLFVATFHSLFSGRRDTKSFHFRLEKNAVALVRPEVLAISEASRNAQMKSVFAAGRVRRRLAQLKLMGFINAPFRVRNSPPCTFLAEFLLQHGLCSVDLIREAHTAIAKLHDEDLPEFAWDEVEHNLDMVSQSVDNGLRFVTQTGDDTVDEMRKLVVQVLQERGTKGAQKSDIATAYRNRAGPQSEMNEAIYRHVMPEFCTSVPGSRWKLKTREEETGLPEEEDEAERIQED